MIIKRIASFLLLATMLLPLIAFTGCHGQKILPEFTVPEEFDTSKQYEIVFWAKNESNPRQTHIYIEALKEFDKIYPNIHITVSPYTDYKDIYVQFYLDFHIKILC